ncbi:MAG TPA: hypothetical protein DEV98_05735 [Clostridiales bacterium]|nr:hypothetical protein [Clostridiales bacterium]
MGRGKRKLTERKGKAFGFSSRKGSCGRNPTSSGGTQSQAAQEGPLEVLCSESKTSNRRAEPRRKK